ncbi:MAG: M28 family metallopeptidase [Flavobacteriaceae bacterium]
MKHALTFFIGCFLLSLQLLSAQTDQRIYEIIESVDADHIKKDVQALVDFGTRHTLSDTVSATRGIGAARRYIKKEFDQIAADCGNCLEVFYQHNFFPKGTNERIVKDVDIVNVVAIKRGKKNPNHFVIMSGDIDSRVSDPADYTSESPGANDNASGMAGTIEAARVLSKYDFDNSIIFVGLAGEEQGLFGGKGLAEYAQNNNWNIIGILNNDMIGNIKGVDGYISNKDFRIFSEPVPVTESEQSRRARRFYGGEVDGHSRQLARYVHRLTKTYMTDMNPMMIYRLDRFGRGGHHRPFNDAGFAGIRIMEAHENYTQQHQDIRVENGIAYGDTFEHVDFDYAAKLTAVNAITLASLAWAPLAPETVAIGGIVQASARLKWSAVEGANGYKVHWRETTLPQWSHSRQLEGVTEHELDGVVNDKFYFGVSAVTKDGHESLNLFPNQILR